MTTDQAGLTWARRWLGVSGSDAERDYKLALELNPNDAGAHLSFAISQLFQGRSEEALAWSRRARELEPLGITGTTIGWILFQARHYDEALRELRSDLAVHLG